MQKGYEKYKFLKKEKLCREGRILINLFPNLSSTLMTERRNLHKDIISSLGSSYFITAHLLKNESRYSFPINDPALSSRPLTTSNNEIRISKIVWPPQTIFFAREKKLLVSRWRSENRRGSAGANLTFLWGLRANTYSTVPRNSSGNKGEKIKSRWSG